MGKHGAEKRFRTHEYVAALVFAALSIVQSIFNIELGPANATTISYHAAAWCEE
jgi:hypothetical protein